MQLGVTIFGTDLTPSPAALARAAEERSFDSFYLPEHTHLPLDAGGPLPSGTTELEDGYRRTLDPFIALATAASVTDRIRLGTGIALIAQHDPIALAKQIATLDHLSDGRVTLGVGYGWNRAEARDHGIDFSRRREVVRDHMLAMGALWRDDVASHQGEFVRFGKSWAWPKPVQRPRVRTLLGGAPSPDLFAEIALWADGWIPFGGAGVAAALPALRHAFEDAGRDPATAWVVPFGSVPDRGKLERFRDLGVQEVVLRLPAVGWDEAQQALDELAIHVEAAHAT